VIVLIHTSKTMRTEAPSGKPARKLGTPALLERAETLMAYLRTLSPQQIAKVMSVSGPLAAKTREQFQAWTPDRVMPAAESFLGDIYSGLQLSSFTAADRTYADAHLRILSGLYGILRPFDGICPYRLEMGYRLPAVKFANLYSYWGRAIADQLPAKGPIVNLAANEYSRAVLNFLEPARVVTPRFLTVDGKGAPRFVAVHAKIARGAFARWLITQRVPGVGEGEDILAFTDLGYRLDPATSTAREPTFVCTEFGGKGLSVRLQ
jgi:cytoplasmic iron level regulating protein YaaA (DUF328/UPF0246 family)